MPECEHDMRDRLGATWRALVERLRGSDFPPHVVYETLAEVAAEGMAESYGGAATAHMLRLRADALDAAERDRLSALLVGDEGAAEAPYPPLMRPGGFGPGAPVPPPPALI